MVSYVRDFSQRGLYLDGNSIWSVRDDQRAIIINNLDFFLRKKKGALLLFSKPALVKSVLIIFAYCITSLF